MIRSRSVFILIIANQTYPDRSEIPRGSLLQVFPSRLSQDDISAEYEHSKIDAELSLTYL